MVHDPGIDTKWGQEQKRKLESYLENYSKRELIDLILSKVTNIIEHINVSDNTIFELSGVFYLSKVATTEEKTVLSEQFIIYYPPGCTYLSFIGSALDNNEIAKHVLEHLHSGKDIKLAKLEGWRIAQRRPNGQFEEIFPSQKEEFYAVCGKCNHTTKYKEEDHNWDYTVGNYIICERCLDRIKI